jgi:hypothetical protein
LNKAPAQAFVGGTGRIWALAVTLWLGGQILLLLVRLLPLPDSPTVDWVTGEVQPVGLLIEQVIWGLAGLAMLATVLGALACVTLLLATTSSLLLARTAPPSPRRAELQSFVVEGFPTQSSAYIYEGRLRWYEGRRTWEWRSDHFEELASAEAKAPFEQHRFIGGVLASEGWKEERLETWNDAWELGRWEVRFETSGNHFQTRTLTISHGSSPRQRFRIRERTRLVRPGTKPALTLLEDTR